MSQSDDDYQKPPMTAAELLAHEEADDLPTGLDLEEVMQMLRSQMAGRPADLLRGMVSGKTVLRDALLDGLRCSVAQAELLVDSLEARGQIRFDEQDQPHGRWTLQ